MADQLSGGTYIVGTFRGFTDGQYPRLRVATFVRDDGSESEEWLNFTPFDKFTGASTLPEGLLEGTRVAARVTLQARAYEKDGKRGMFVSKDVRAIEVL